MYHKFVFVLCVTDSGLEWVGDEMGLRGGGFGRGGGLGGKGME